MAAFLAETVAQDLEALHPAAAVGHHRPPVQLLLDAGGAVDDGVVAVAGLWVADGDDQAGGGVDGDLQVRRVPVILAPGGRPVIASGDRSPVDDRGLFDRIRSIALNFWDAYLKSDAKAKERLTAGQFGTNVTVDRK